MDKAKIALLVIYNHRYDRNIPRIESLYKDRFHNLYHVMPFYDGDQENVIPVYESSHFFQGYIAQAYQHIAHRGYTHYFVVPDDMIINPRINEDNLHQYMGLAADVPYIDELVVFQTESKRWYHTQYALDYNPHPVGVEVNGILPSVQEARARFDALGLPYGPLPPHLCEVSQKEPFVKKAYKIFCRLRGVKPPLKGKLRYPMVRGYSDILVIPDTLMPRFCQYCGAFAATRLFVEIAIPTSLVLLADKISTTKSLRLRGLLLWDKDRDDFIETYHADLDELCERYPEDLLFVHPIKLSQWH